MSGFGFWIHVKMNLITVAETKYVTRFNKFKCKYEIAEARATESARAVCSSVFFGGICASVKSVRDATCMSYIHSTYMSY